jgi:MFS family permease
MLRLAADGRALFAAVAVTTAAVLPAFLTGGLAVQIRASLGFDERGLGVAIGAYFAAAAISSVGLGRLSERLGPTRSLRAAALASAAALAGISLFSTSLVTLCVLLALGGFCNAFAQPAANLLLARGVPTERLGWAFAVKQSAIPLATLLAGLAVPTIAVNFGWRWAYAGAAALAGLSSFLPKASAQQKSNGGENQGTELRTRHGLLVLTVALLFAAAAANGFGAFLVSAAVNSGLSAANAGLTLTGGSLVCVAARLYAGYRADRRCGGNLRVAAWMLAGSMLAFALLSAQNALLIVFVTPFAFGIGWAWPPLTNLAVVRAEPEKPAAATGVTQMGIHIGAIIGPALFGQLVSLGSYGIAWAVMAALAATSAVLVMISRQLLVARLRFDP